MAHKYLCDDCGEELSSSDNIAEQLDMTNRTYCKKCFKNHRDLYEPKSWTNKENKENEKRLS